MKLMIVEDEPLMRRGLISKIDWADLELTLAGEAASGQEALRLLSEQQPDIVLTDIRMPGMSGLEFIREARNLCPALKFIIISGYDEFDYVREALQHKVKDYLLKPVDPDKLHLLLLELGKEVRQEREAASYYAYLDEIGKIYNGRDLRPDDHRYTRFLLEPGCRLSEVPPELLGWPLHCTAVAKISAVHGQLPADEEDLALHRFAVHNVFHNGILAACGQEPDGDVIVFNHVYKREEVVILIGCEDHAMLRETAGQLERLLAWMIDRLKITLTIGMGGVKDSPNQLKASYIEAGKRLKDSWLTGDGKLFACSAAEQAHLQAAPISAPYPALPEPSKHSLIAMLEEGQSAGFVDTVIQFMQTELSPQGSYEHIEFLYTEVIHLLRSYSRERGIRLPAAILSAPLADLEQANDWQELRVVLLKQLEQLSLLTSSRQGDRSSGQIVREVRQYVDGHYAEDLNLQWVANNYFIHPNYFSKRFKQMTGSSFSDYITGVRIKNAQRLLADTSFKIQRIAQMVGYEDQNYFCHVFRKAAGVSPTQYRKGLEQQG